MKRMGNSFVLLHFMPTMFSFFYLLFLPSKTIAGTTTTTTTTTDTITEFQSLTANQTLVSKNGNFELGFFTPGNSTNHYLGIWYSNIPLKTVVWVANRQKPITGAAALTINNNTILLTQTKNNIAAVVWSVILNPKPSTPVLLRLLDTGNLVVREQEKNGYLWQSFDYPCDTLLPGMKLGKDLRTGLDRRLTAWKSSSDPSRGTLNWGMDITNWPQLMQRVGPKKQFDSGPWIGPDYSGKPSRKPNPIFRYMYFSDENEVYYTYRLVNSSAKARMVVNQTSNRRVHLVWDEEGAYWKMYVSLPRDFCDGYGACGPNANCDQSKFPGDACDCLRGFRPKSPEEWNGGNYAGGCVRDDRALKCRGADDGFFKYAKMKVPDTENSWLNQSMSLAECRDKCLRNCSCMAYANSDIRGAGSGCAIWFGDLNSLRIQPDAGQDFYVRVPASELETKKGGRMKIGIAVGVSVAALCGLLLALYFISIRRRVTVKKNALVVDYFKEEQDEDLELPLFDLSSIVKATDNFSVHNKLGEGGFGPVYKGTLENGQEIAVKRLSRGSGQGLKEFKNEIALIAKLQHRNLVKLHGCCIQDEERLIIYEYMPNKSLDFFIFDQTQGTLLDWSKRFHIICGIARGLVYLHQDSRLRIIHRDLKASNVLLDSEMNPKISDFGLAKILGGDQSAETTRRVVGTYGYMAPEYAIDGNFSVKSDVFSFGVLLLEIVSGKKNKGNHQKKESTNLIGYAWDLWTEGRPLELIGEYLKDSCNVSEALRCIHISLLCVQQHPHERPSMSSVVMMLKSQIGLPQPKQPALFVEEYSYQDSSITVLEAR